MERAHETAEAVPETTPARGSAQAPAALPDLTGGRLARMDSGARANLARSLQGQVGNRAATRQLARKTLKEKVEEARKSDPAGYVLKAVGGMSGDKFSDGDRVHEITWRMIWMFIPERISGTLVNHDTSGKLVELDKDPPPKKGDVMLKVGTDFVTGLTAENLMGRVAVLRAVFLGKDVLMAKLKAEFGFSSVVDGDASWTAGQLAAVYAGLAKMPKADRSALGGVVLRRDHKVEEHGKQMAGLYQTSVPKIEATDTTAPPTTKTLILADLAFPDADTAQFVAVHEAGHAVDSEKHINAAAARTVTLVASNATVGPLNAAGDASRVEMNATIGRVNKYARKDFQAASGYVSAIKTVHERLNAFVAAQVTGLAAAEKAADQAIAARDKALAALAPGNPAAADFSTTTTLQNDWFAKAKARAAARLADAAAQKAVTDATATIQGAAGRHSTRLAAFVAVVRRNNIAPITPYARENWPAHPEEFFAEAYSMWLNEPKKLDQKASALKKFFDDGEQNK